MRGTPAALVVSAVALLLVAGPSPARDVRDLYYGEALYQAYQEHYFEALERLDAELAQHYRLDEPRLDTLQHHIGDAEFFVGDFELRYRMHLRAGRAIRAVLEGNVEEPVRNEAAFRLARIHFQKDQPEMALKALERIHGEVPGEIRADVEFLRANVYMALGRPADAIETLRGLHGAGDLEGFAAYNLGVALLQEGREQDGLEQLDRAGQMRTADQATLAIRDKSNLVLGTLQLESAAYGPAQRSLQRVRLEGPFSNMALLRAGWADATAEHYQRALVPWGILAERERTDAAVQEALLALPYAYSRLELHGRAAQLYGRAVGAYGEELDKVDASIRSIREGKFLEALVREEIRHDKEWVIRLRSLPDAPETFYLTTLMASHDFQTALQNYLDLEDLRRKLVSWDTSFGAFEDMVRLRRAYYEPLLPEIDQKFRALDAQIRLRTEQRKNLDKRLQGMLIAPRPDYLATADERLLAAEIARAAAGLEGDDDPDAEALRRRVERLRGTLTWRLETEYHERLTDAYRHLQELNEVVETLTAQYQAYVRTRQAAMHSYVGYDEPIRDLRRRVAGALDRLNLLMARQGHMLETVAVNELKVRRQRLEVYQNQARYAFADSYDRAAKAQAAVPQAAEDRG